MRSRSCRKSPARACAAAVLGAVLALVLIGASAAAQEFDIPEGFVAALEPEVSGTSEWRPLMTVRPVGGAFAGLSAIHLREVVGRVEDPDDWLKRRLAGEVGDPKGAEDVFTSPDSPFGDPFFDAFRKAIPELFESMQKLADLPLEFCDEPQTGYNAIGAYRELYCVYNLGPIRQYLVLRLQSAGAKWFYTEIRTMNEQRLRHLMAIADSFHMGEV